MFTKEQINEILAVCEKATEGPWEAEHGEWDCNWECGHKAGDPECHKEICECEHIKQYIPADVRPLFTVDCGDFMGLSDDNADFIALARTALPQLAEDYRKLLAVAEAVEKAVANATDTLRNVNGNFAIECWNINPEDMDNLIITLANAGYGGEE